ncbi:MAG: serine/threonine-protein kinase, partial [Vicinamibacterales bacterium]
MATWCPTCFGELSPNGSCLDMCSNELLESETVDLPVGTYLDLRYVIGGVLGRGGFGITYLGWQQVPGRRVAIKEYIPQTVAVRTQDLRVVPAGRASSTEFNQGLTAFVEETDRLAKFHGHAHIVSVFDFVYANDTAYMIMEYCPGETALKYLRNQGGAVTFDDAVAIVGPVLDALDALHARGVYHRDVSPDNILITEQGVKLIDFGAARTALRDRSMSFSAILKMAYAPPEQYQRKGNQGPWTDVFAAAATMYHLLVGEPPPTAMDRLQRDDIASPAARGVVLPASADRAIMRALALQVENRTQRASEFRRELGTDVVPTPQPVVIPSPEPPNPVPVNSVVQPPRPIVDVPPPPPPPVTSVTPGINRRVIGVVAAMLLLAIVGLVAWRATKGSTPQIVSFVAEPESLTSPGTPVTLRWRTSGASRIDIVSNTQDVNRTGLDASGELTVSPSLTTTYQLTAAGTPAATSFVVVAVEQPSAPAAERPPGVAGGDAPR